MGIISLIPVVLCLVFMKNNPKTPPNYSITTHHLSMIDSIKAVFFNPKNLIDTIALSLYLGINWTFLSVLDYIL